MKKFKVLKMLRKGVEGCILAGGGAEGVMQSIAGSDALNSVSKQEHIIVVVACALAGFAIKSLKNWIKNR